MYKGCKKCCICSQHKLKNFCKLLQELDNKVDQLHNEKLCKKQNSNFLSNRKSFQGLSTKHSNNKSNLTLKMSINQFQPEGKLDLFKLGSFNLNRLQSMQKLYEQKFDIMNKQILNLQNKIQTLQNQNKELKIYKQQFEFQINLYIKEFKQQIRSVLKQINTNKINQQQIMKEIQFLENMLTKEKLINRQLMQKINILQNDVIQKNKIIYYTIQTKQNENLLTIDQRKQSGEQSLLGKSYHQMLKHGQKIEQEFKKFKQQFI